MESLLLLVLAIVSLSGAAASAWITLRRCPRAAAIRAGETIVVHTVGEAGRSVRGVLVRDLEPSPGAGGLQLAACELLDTGGEVLALEGESFVPRAAIAFVQIVPARQADQAAVS